MKKKRLEMMRFKHTAADQFKAELEMEENRDKFVVFKTSTGLIGCHAPDGQSMVFPSIKYGMTAAFTILEVCFAAELHEFIGKFKDACKNGVIVSIDKFEMEGAASFQIIAGDLKHLFADPDDMEIMAAEIEVKGVTCTEILADKLRRGAKLWRKGF